MGAPNAEAIPAAAPQATKSAKTEEEKGRRTRTNSACEIYDANK